MTQQAFVVREADALKILRRAATIDGEALDAARLRAVAVEAGISVAAVDQALAEHKDAVLRERSKRPWWRHPAAVVVEMGASVYLATILGFIVYMVVQGMSVIEAIRQLFDIR